MTAMGIVLTVVVLWTVLVMGVLIGASIHREATRRRRRRVAREQANVEHDRALLESERRLLDR